MALIEDKLLTKIDVKHFSYLYQITQCINDKLRKCSYMKAIFQAVIRHINQKNTADANFIAIRTMMNSIRYIIGFTAEHHDR